MLSRSITSAIFLFFLCIAIFVQTSPALSQSATSASPISSSTSIQDLERKLSELEFKQNETLEILKTSNKYNQFLITGMGAIVGFLVAIQGVVAYRQSTRERELRGFENTNIERVNKIMGVVQNTLQSRLDSEEQARQDAQDAQNQLNEVMTNIKSLQVFFDRYQTAIQSERERIEEQAANLAKKSRHDFRSAKDELGKFAQKFENFAEQYQQIEENKTEFSSRVLYIKGIAAHYQNSPEEAKNYLSKVVSSSKPLSDETKPNCERRIANAYYYLGVMESNFDNNEDAIKFFEESRKLDVGKDDLLTKVVIAESYLMLNDYKRTAQIIEEVQSYPVSRPIHARLRNRADLLLTNMKILKHDENWRVEGRNILERIYQEAPLYYYATATLAQLLLQEDPDRATELFRETFETIVRLGDLITLEEIRSKILLFMVTAMCCIGEATNINSPEAGEYLDRARGSLDELPDFESRKCTVYSPLSKRNESIQVINEHIARIRKGDIGLIFS